MLYYIIAYHLEATNHPHPHIPFWSKENHPIYSGRKNMYRHISGN